MPALGAVLIALSVWNAFSAGGEFTLPPENVKLKPGPGMELVQAQCVLCHSLDYISTQPPLTRPQWEASIAKMQQKYGAPVPTNAVPRLADYLVTAYGPKSSGGAK